jgi:alkyl hydroperoxide reductase subunit AhpC
VAAFRSALERLAALDAQVVGISVDSVFSHVAWQKHDVGMLPFPLCSDFWPHGEVARRYGLLREAEPVAGVSERAVYVVDKEGKIVYARVYRLDQVPEAEDCIQALEAARDAGR